MAANTTYTGSTDDTLTFDKPIGHVVVSVSSGTTFALSIDKGTSYMTVPAGLHDFRIGAITEIRVQSDGAWQLIGIQA